MATRPFDFGNRNYLDLLNDLYYTGMPRIRSDSQNPDSNGVTVTADRTLVYEDLGSIVDVNGTVTLSVNTSVMQDGWSLIVNTIAGTATVSASGAGTTFVGGAASKTIAAGNAAVISCDGTNFRIFRFSSAT